VRKPALKWNAMRAKALVGKVLIIGLTIVEKDGSERDDQFWGVVETVDKDAGIVVALRGLRAGRQWTLPADFRSLHKAEPGDYTLRATGEVVASPAYFATMKVDAP
jgi:hypothetical protein